MSPAVHFPAQRAIDVDTAEVLVYGSTDTLKQLAIQDVSEHRWYTKQLVVFEGTLNGETGTWGFHYLAPATELQEDQDRFEADPVPVFPVVGKTVTVTVWEPEEVPA
jgi:hypothetical protein